MSETYTTQSRFLCGNGEVVFQLAGNIAVGVCCDDGVDYITARAGADSGGFDKPFFVSDYAGGLCAGMFLDSVDKLFYPYRRGHFTDSAQPELALCVVELKDIEGGSLIRMCLFHCCYYVIQFFGGEQCFKSCLRHLFKL